MTNTQLRILSAIVLVSIVLLAFWLGKTPAMILVLIVGCVCIDEIWTNFCLFQRKSKEYFFTQLSFVGFFSAINFASTLVLSKFVVLTIAVLLNLFLIFYLFGIPLEKRFMFESNKKYPGIVNYIVAFPIISMGRVFEENLWWQYMTMLLVLTYSMDTGAWFFGKKFGKKKLMPQISPKKTVEGFYGGVLTSGIVGSLVWYLINREFNLSMFFVFSFLGGISQVGDLIQSKMKREFGIKDSSNLIPGHGGVYDRIDSLIFLSPIFTIVVKYIGQ